MSQFEPDAGINDPNFIVWMKQRYGAPLKPDDQDFDWTVKADTVTEQANQYRLAQARKILRVYEEWKALSN